MALLAELTVGDANEFDTADCQYRFRFHLDEALPGSWAQPYLDPFCVFSADGCFPLVGGAIRKKTACGTFGLRRGVVSLSTDSRSAPIAVA